MNLKVPIATESKYLIHTSRELTNQMYLNTILPENGEPTVSLGGIYKSYINSPEYRLIDAIKDENSDPWLVLQRIRENNEKHMNSEVKPVNVVLDEITALFLGTLSIMKEMEQTFPGMLGERIDKSIRESREEGWVFRSALMVEWVQGKGGKPNGKSEKS